MLTSMLSEDREQSYYLSTYLVGTTERKGFLLFQLLARRPEAILALCVYVVAIGMIIIINILVVYCPV